MFFALKGDLEAALETVEGPEPLRYTRMGQFAGRELETFVRGVDIPNFGRANTDSAIACESFVVAARSVAIVARPIISNSGDERYCVDQFANPDTVAFTPSGLWNDEVILHGRVATASSSQQSHALMKTFGAAFRKHFTKIKAFHVGPEARSLLATGRRLTVSAQSPSDGDLGE